MPRNKKIIIKDDKYSLTLTEKILKASKKEAFHKYICVKYEINFNLNYFFGIFVFVFFLRRLREHLETINDINLFIRKEGIIKFTKICIFRLIRSSFFYGLIIFLQINKICKLFNKYIFA